MGEYPDRKAETRAVKAALKWDYPDVRVRHGKGTSWGWLKVKLSIPRPADCRCKEENEGKACSESCRTCKTEWSRTYDSLCQRIQEFTGRKGEYGGEIGLDIDFQEA